MTLYAAEQTKFRAWLAHRLLLKVEILIPEYIHSNDYLNEDIYDKGYDEVAQAYVSNVSNLEFHWTPSPLTES